ncbi:hypothetical protein EYM_01030 [Ignicoccus islandicus DSM 13165]|uniref:Uncharacterized protein n=1 Tax=Ignicoccus islandicus DSM 13165 TaxID=940295 RepID=A0A0U3DXE1_9CREN|nr:hypothetical protein [Ignicoccus islandicus]ALU12170.1 hypothetical protein EYM_01030 [Ignicoccus islandicus DSM 13165]
MKEFDLTTQSAVCGDMVSNLAMVAQELEPGEEAKVKIPKEYEKEIEIYKDMLKMLDVEIEEISKEGDEIILILKKLPK